MSSAKSKSLVYTATINGIEIARRVSVADTFRARTIGLLGHNQLPAGEMLWIHSAPSIHTMGMRFTIDVFFLNRVHEVVRVVWAVAPFRMVMGGLGADSVLEAQTGWLDRSLVTRGSRVVFSAVPSS